MCKQGHFLELRLHICSSRATASSLQHHSGSPLHPQALHSRQVAHHEVLQEVMVLAAPHLLTQTSMVAKNVLLDMFIRRGYMDLK
jgi:hypothetical protein